MIKEMFWWCIHNSTTQRYAVYTNYVQKFLLGIKNGISYLNQLTISTEQSPEKSPSPFTDFFANLKLSFTLHFTWSTIYRSAIYIHKTFVVITKRFSAYTIWVKIEIIIINRIIKELKSLYRWNYETMDFV
jgi:hypothetical protein